MARRHNIETRLTATDKTKAAFNRVQKRMKSLKKASLIAGGGVAAVAAGFVAASKRAVEYGDHIAKTSKQLKISTDALQEMHLAVDLAGVSTAQLEKGLGGLGKRLGELVKGQGTLHTFLTKNDDDFRQQLLSAKSLSAAFKMIIKRMDGMNDQTKKLALSGTAFGRGVGQALAGMSFKDFEKGLQLAREFGVVIDKKFLKEAEKIKDAFTIVSAVFRKEFFTEILNMLSTMDLPKFAKDMAKLAAATVKFVRAIGEWFNIIEKADTPLQKLQSQLAVTEASIRRLTDPRMQFGPAGQMGVNEWSKHLLGLRKKADDLRKAIDLIKNPQKIVATDTRLPPDSGKPKQHLLPFPGDGSDVETTLTKLTTKLAEYRAGISKTKTNLQELNTQNFASIEALENEAQRLETTRGVQEALNAMRKDGLGISEAFENALLAEAHAVDALNRNLEKKKELLQPGPIQQYIDRTKDLNTSLQEVAVRGADRLTESLIGIMDGTQKAGEAFKSMARSIIADMQRMIIKKMILDKVMGFIEGMLPGGKTGGKTEKRALGGPVSAGRPYIVGERGPELMVPGRGGNIVPNHALGGAVVNQTINIQTGVSQTVRAEIIQLMPQINESTKNAILDARRRGGSFADGFA